MRSQTWRRGPCNGHRTCTIVQTSELTAPPPPKPTDAELAKWSHSFDGHPCPNVEPVIFLVLEILDGDLRPHWVGRCRVCSAVNRWRSAADAHYRAHGVKLSTGPLVGWLDLTKL
ncbi:MAG: hypothetical protein ACRD07_19310 [Acidimicrobiales bacterium]